MFSRLVTVLLTTVLVGCTTIKTVAESTDTFAVCKTVDVVSTYVGLSSGNFIEANPIMAKVISFGWLPFVAVSLGSYLLLVEVNNKQVTTAANTITCGVSANNVFLLIR
jgi:hypothetical protein